ncbi:hypothetical protein QKU48_gp1008 [Fadolivirus algeromassiliense]|uniref:Uncharacterized protein n=1 Tax=Fadolivirus FV1/VV64 TaxID=3070911 RepID=A0A7D3QWE7_9VIRU|nr:hypothetical protein QKU48_gp1008 [Fadolivirus algeromassiliense]QKF94466.1 hypothetical protein Fadolivirus_1_1008 [Fadolivirus FV1/VV64]
MKIDELDYVVINSGYTERLVNRLFYDCITAVKENDSLDKYNKNGIFIIKQVNEFENDPYDAILDRNDSLSYKDFEIHQNIDLLINNLIFIYDGLCGEGLYKTENSNNADNIIRTINDETKILRSGTVCFKCKSIGRAMEIIKILKKFNFCYGIDCNAITEIEYVDKDNIKIAIISLDTESG